MPKSCKLDSLTPQTTLESIKSICTQEQKATSTNKYPTPDQLWEDTFSQANQWRDRFAAIPFEDKSGTWEARYYQHNAIKHFLEAISQGKNRILLTMATGTGKTFVAFQLAWKLFQSRWNFSQQLGC